MCGYLALLCFLSLLFVVPNTHSQCLSAPCESEIYCSSDLLRLVQLSDVYKDSKTFVDKPLKQSPERVLSAFYELPANVSSVQLNDFFSKYFDDEGKELESWIPSDQTDTPEILNLLTDLNLRQFAADLNEKWGLLGRKVKNEVKVYQDRHSLIYVPNPFIIPGGRFRELYYWDSYWIIQGLLACDMTQTVKLMLGNFVSVIQRFGFMPNGGRVYYLNRSQPPLFIPMVMSYISHTNDTQFVRQHMSVLEQEYEFWRANRSVSVRIDGSEYTVYQYKVDNCLPRPESYREDYKLAANLTSDQASRLYAEIAAAAESGWDFSTRWFRPGGSTLQSLDTQNKIPIDLNAFLCWNTRILADLHALIGNSKRAEFYYARYRKHVETIHRVFWDESSGSWFDYDIRLGARDTRFFASTLTPMFTSCHGLTSAERRLAEDGVQRYITRLFGDLDTLHAGVPTSDKVSGQQWDSPNAWPPLQHMWIVALTNADSASLRQTGETLAKRWITAIWLKWLELDEKTKTRYNMYEKYNAYTGKAGEGGEYEVQLGFGWTNGVVLDLLKRFPKITVEDELRPKSGSSGFSPLMVSLSVFTSVATFLIMCL